MATRDASSYSENVNFVSASDLHINPTIQTYAESGGATIVGITDDYDGNTRNATTPDIGADEFAGIPYPMTVASGN